MRSIVFIHLLILLALLNSCQIIDKPEEVPSFIYLDSFNFQSSTSQGSSSNKITDVWVYVDDNLAGMWELPATIPLHYKGSHKVSLYPGIKKNGASGYRVIYPFYTAYEANIELIQDSIIPINPSIQYKSGLSIWVEDFEDPGIKLFNHSTSDTSMIVVSNPPYTDLIEGNAGAIFMDADNFSSEMRTNELNFNNFPKQLDIPAYIEFDYKCNHEFYIGLLHKDNSVPSYQSMPLVTFYPTIDDNGISQWNKTYVYIPDGTNFFPSATDFDLYIQVLNPDAKDGIEIFMDNIKVIYNQ